MRRGLATALLALATSAACGDSTTAPREALLVSVASPSVVASRSEPGVVTWGQIPVEVTLRNPTSFTVRVYSCAPTAERETASGWQVALEPICAMIGPDYIEMLPGSARTQKTVITGAVTGAGGPAFLGGVLAGHYRLLYRYLVVGDVGLMDEARSAPFDVTE
jgi:hypothetical protein